MESFVHYFVQALLLTFLLLLLFWVFQRQIRQKTDKKSTTDLLASISLLFIVSMGLLAIFDIRQLSKPKQISKKTTTFIPSSPVIKNSTPEPASMSSVSGLDYQLYHSNELDTRFKDIIGVEQTKKELQGIIKLYQADSDLPLPNGFLFFGPPGTGKTLMARAFAAEAGMNIITVSGADFEDKYIGEGAKKVRMLFSLARKHAPAIIFIDEIDAMAPIRQPGYGEMNIQTVNMLLSELDNFDKERNKDIILLAATNRIESIDKALLRPGRFDKRIYFDLPEQADRLAILSKQAKRYGYQEFKLLQELSENTKGYSPAELQNIIEQAVISANLEGRKKPNNQDLLNAFATSEKELMDMRNAESTFDVSLSKASTIDTRFTDVAGLDEVKADLKQTIDFLKHPSKYHKMGAILPRGIILHGPPGTGKTLMARAMAGESGVNFISTSGSAFVDTFVGQGANHVRELFTTARQFAPCIVFIDEIDALLTVRNDANASEYSQTTNEFLVQMDNINEKANDGIIVMGATNRIKDIDPAAIRPGRFDQKIYVRLPNLEERKAILNYYLRKVKASKNIDTAKIAGTIGGFSGADIKNLVNLGALRAVEQKRNEIALSDLEYAKDNMVLGKEQKSANVLQSERYTTAIHEAGHALVGLLSEHYPQELYKITIGVRNESLGVTHFNIDSERYSLSKQAYIDIIATMMGGRIAEEIIFGHEKITGGASNDLMRSTQLAVQMVRELVLGDNDDMIAYAAMPYPPSEIVNKQINDILKEARDRAYQLLTKREKALRALANTLLEKETLFIDEVKAVVGNSR